MSLRLSIEQHPSIIDVEAGETILAAALSAGVPYPHSCRSGRCGACKSRLLSGNVELLPYSRFALEEDERRAGIILACRSLPLADVSVAWGAADPAGPTTHVGLVIAKREVAPGILRLVAETKEAAIFRPGQFFSLAFDGLPSRSYSPASQPGQRTIEFHIRVIPGGVVGQHLIDEVEAGDPVTMQGPFGEAFLREDISAPLLAAAAGSGLAPIKSIVDRALEIDPLRRVDLFVSARTRAEVYLGGYFLELSQRHRNLKYRTVLTREGVEPIRLPDLLLRQSQSLAEHHVHIAGPAGFVDDTRSATALLGAAKANTFADLFTPTDDRHRHGGR